MPILPKIEPPPPEWCTLYQIIQWLAHDIRPVPVEYEALGFYPRLDPDTTRSAVRHLYGACVEKKITLEGYTMSTLITQDGSQKRVGWPSKFHPIPVSVIVEGGLEAFDVERNVHRHTGPLGSSEFLSVRTTIAQVFERFPPLAPTEPMISVASAGIPPVVQQSSGSPTVADRNPGGKPWRLKWHEIWFLLMRYLDNKERPKTQAGVIRLVQKLCVEHNLEVPDESTLKPKISLMFKIWPRPNR